MPYIAPDITSSIIGTSFPVSTKDSNKSNANFLISISSLLIKFIETSVAAFIDTIDVLLFLNKALNNDFVYLRTR